MTKNLRSVAKGSTGQRKRCSFREYGHIVLDTIQETEDTVI